MWVPPTPPPPTPNGSRDVRNIGAETPSLPGIPTLSPVAGSPRRRSQLRSTLLTPTKSFGFWTVSVLKDLSRVTVRPSLKGPSLPVGTDR